MQGSGRFLYRLQESEIRSLYARVKERANAAGKLLRGTPGTLVKRTGTGHEYWYRSYYPLPKKRSEDYVGPVRDLVAREGMQGRIEHADWTAKQVSALGKLGYQVADKDVAAVLVELHNQEFLESGIVVVGTLATMVWLNEYGVRTGAAWRRDVGLARRQTLKLAAAAPLPPCALGLGVELIADPFHDYLFEGSRAAALLAGGHCVPVLLPQVSRMIWHKLYASTRRAHEPAKAEKDLLQAATLAAVLIETDRVPLRESFKDAPLKLRAAAYARLRRMDALLAAHPQAREGFRELE